MLEPLTFAPVYKEYVWGGQRIPRVYHRAGAPEICAESWEISAHPDGMSVVDVGPLRGRTLASLVDDFGVQLLGTHPAPGKFPLLLKIIDARDRLSVQVHPNDEDAQRYGGEAKNEAWHILEADPGAIIFAGMKPGTRRSDFEEAIRHTRIDRLLSEVPVRNGDSVVIPGGLVHALDSGLMIYEIQQSSNTTYRIYDWGRVGHDGKPRETHVAQALRVIAWRDQTAAVSQPVPVPAEPGVARFHHVETPYFRMDRIALGAPHRIAHGGGSFHAIFCASGALRIAFAGHARELPLGASALIPAALTDFTLEPVASGTEVLLVWVPSSSGSRNIRGDALSSHRKSSA
ncbi:MAG: class I mannose-6-phosphate isomerase [Kiritimatiellae bacterium]|nr:class I mannose-6-phosphate isomerase [Kiritimatiellia bacterium]